jgi:ArsR family transcriptional regulator
MEHLARSLKILGDPTRLRILRLLSAEPLSVGELTTILGLAQPSVSKQLGELKRAGLVREERDGGYAFYRLDEDGGRLWPVVAEELDRAGDPEGDLARLAEVLRRRADRGGGRKVLEPGRSWPAWARALGHLIPPLKVADLCCGDGALTAEIARWARQVIAVDRDAARLREARRRIAREGFSHVRFRCEPVERLSLAAGSVELVILSQALHYFEDPDEALGQARRILIPGGRLLLLDLAPHGESWVRDKLGHVHLGFGSDELRALVARAGFEHVHVDELRKGPAQPFRILVLAAVKDKTPATRAKSPKGGRRTTRAARTRGAAGTARAATGEHLDAAGRAAQGATARATKRERSER